jgi:hypothetical protein
VVCETSFGAFAANRVQWKQTTSKAMMFLSRAGVRLDFGDKVKCHLLLVVTCTLCEAVSFMDAAWTVCGGGGGGGGGIQ